MTNECVTLPREVVEQTLEALIYCEAPDSSSEEQRFQAAIALRAALEQPIMSGTIRDFIEGMSVSVDVSADDHDAGRRYFGTVTEVMDAPEDKHGVTLLVQDAEPNFEQPQIQSGGDDAGDDRPNALRLERHFKGAHC